MCVRAQLHCKTYLTDLNLDFSITSPDNIIAIFYYFIPSRVTKLFHEDCQKAAPPHELTESLPFWNIKEIYKIKVKYIGRYYFQGKKNPGRT